MYVTFDLTDTEELMPQQAIALGINSRQSWRKAVVALAAFAVCIQLFWSVQSSPVQSSP